MKVKKIIGNSIGFIGGAVFIICWGILGVMYGLANSRDKNPVPELRTERIQEIYRYKDMIGVFCIDGYKWIVTASDIEQAFRVDSKGNSVPARCDE